MLRPARRGRHPVAQPHPMTSDPTQKLSVREKLGYSCGDAAANFVFMTMILFQSSFYTDVFGITASAAVFGLMVKRSPIGAKAIFGWYISLISAMSPNTSVSPMW